jgi:RNA-directed DNA polymerase
VSFFLICWEWARRRHPQKGKKWIADKYFGTVNGRKWTFAEITGKANLPDLSDNI